MLIYCRKFVVFLYDRITLLLIFAFFFCFIFPQFDSGSVNIFAWLISGYAYIWFFLFSFFCSVKGTKKKAERKELCLISTREHSPLIFNLMTYQIKRLYFLLLISTFDGKVWLADRETFPTFAFILVRSFFFFLYNSYMESNTPFSEIGKRNLDDIHTQ